MPNNLDKCCDMRTKVQLAIARVLSEEECGIPDTVMADFHDFSYQSPTNLPVAAALVTQYCAWCGAKRRPNEKRTTTEVIQPHH